MITEKYKMKLSPNGGKIVTLTVEKEVLDAMSDDEIANQLSAFIFDHLKFTDTQLVYLWVNNGCENDTHYTKLRNYIIDLSDEWTFDASRDPDNDDLIIALRKHQQKIIIEKID